jgi:hypothetical protein
MNVQTAILQHSISISVMCASGPWETDIRTVEVELAISLTDERASGPMLIDVRTMIFKLRFLPYLWARPDGVSFFPYSELGMNLKLIDHWWTSVRAAEMSGRMQAGTESFRYSGGSGRKDTSSGRMEQLTDGRPDKMVRRPNGWQGI